MGACFSSKRSKSDVKLETIRVVRLDGSLEDYEDPATVEQVVNKFPKHFLCTPIQILQNGLIPMQPDHQLETGQIYFMLPNSTLQFNASPMDLISLTRRLTNIAKTGRCLTNSIPTSPTSPLLNPISTCPNRLLDNPCGGDGVGNMGTVQKSSQWKPILATIRERSFNQRNVSLKYEHFESFRVVE